MQSNSNKKQPKLPWWVELLFVQIGLPDSWLSSLLKRKKLTTKIINDNKKYIICTLFLFGGICYIYPIVKYTSSGSSCIEKTTDYLKNVRNFDEDNELDINSIAVGYCHGGDLPK